MLRRILVCCFLALSSLSAFGYSPTVRSTASPTFTWDANPSAATYRFYLTQTRVSPQPNIVLTPTQAGCASGTGTCSYTPSSPTFSIPLQRGHYANWWLESYSSSGSLLSSAALQFWVANIAGSTNDFSVDFIDTFDSTPCLWHYVTDFLGQSRRVIDLILTYTGNVVDQSSIGYYAFPENQFSTVDISDILPAGADVRAVLIDVEYISTATCSAPYCDLLGLQFRRTGATALNIPNILLRYKVPPTRVSMQVIAPVSGGKFDVLWSHIANGIDVAATNGASLSGRAFNGSVVGYCAAP